MKKLPLIFILMFILSSIIPKCFGQPGANYLHFSLLDQNNSLVDKDSLKNYQVSIVELQSERWLLVKNNETGSRAKLDTSGFNISLG